MEYSINQINLARLWYKVGYKPKISILLFFCDNLEFDLRYMISDQITKDLCSLRSRKVIKATTIIEQHQNLIKKSIEIHSNFERYYTCCVKNNHKKVNIIKNIKQQYNINSDIANIIIDYSDLLRCNICKYCKNYIILNTLKSDIADTRINRFFKKLYSTN